MKRFRRLYFDIETSYGVYWAWRTGKQFLSSRQLIESPKVICICYKWHDEDEVHELHWTKSHSEKTMLKKFSKILNEADEVCAHNGDRFDIKFFRGRCFINGVLVVPEITTLDTLKLAKKMTLPSYKLNDLDKLCGGDGKMDTGGIDLWHDTQNNKPGALDKMIEYCKKDVLVLERVHKKLEPYFYSNMHIGMLEKSDKLTCPYCTGKDFHLDKTRTTKTGIVKRQMKCNSCSPNRYFTISDRLYQNHLIEKHKQQ